MDTSLSSGLPGKNFENEKKKENKSQQKTFGTC